MKQQRETSSEGTNLLEGVENGGGCKGVKPTRNTETLTGSVGPGAQSGD